MKSTKIGVCESTGDHLKSIAVTFGDGSLRWRLSAKRLKRELKVLGLFDDVISYDLFDLVAIDKEVARFVLTNLRRGDSKGCGYWIWKSSIVLHAKKEFPQHTVVYLDSGFCVRNIEFASMQFKQLLNLASQSRGLALQLPHHTERQYSKQEVIKEIDTRLELIDTNQVQAGFIIVPPELPLDFFRKWREFMLLRDGDLLRSESSYVDDPEYKSHRNDQSIFSLLWKQHNYGYVLDMTDPAEASQGIIAARFSSMFNPYNISLIFRLLRLLEKCCSKVFVWFLEPLRIRLLLWKMSR